MNPHNPLVFHWVSPDETSLLAAVRELFEEYQAELGIDLCFQGFEEELASLPGKYGPPSGALLAVLDRGQAVGCGALRDLGDATCEMKRLYVRPSHRSRHLGQEIAEALIDKGRQLGYRTMRLDTLRRLESAHRLYVRLGFKEVAPYNFNPEPDIVYLEKPIALGATPPASSGGVAEDSLI